MPAPADKSKFSPEIERRRMVSVSEAAEFLSVSPDSFGRHYPHLIRKVTPRLRRVRLGDLIDETSANT